MQNRNKMIIDAQEQNEKMLKMLNELKNDLESYKKNNDDLEIKNKSLIASLENEKEKNENLMQNRNTMIIDAQEQNEKIAPKNYFMEV